MWRRLLAACHPDSVAGDHELFVWADALREHVAGYPGADAPKYVDHQGKPRDDQARVPFAVNVNHDELTRRALDLAASGGTFVPPVYAFLLELLSDCHAFPGRDPRLLREEAGGAGYMRLAAIGHACGFGKASRARWYRIAESVPLPHRHAGHILGRLKEDRLMSGFVSE